MIAHPLPPLPPDAWESSKQTLHLYAQIVGKIRMALMPERNHWWHVTLYVSSRGLTTRPIPYNGMTFEIMFDFIDHNLIVATNHGESRSMALHGQPVAEFYAELFSMLGSLGIDVAIRALPYDTQSTIPFAEDHEHASYDAEYVRRYWEILSWIEGVFWEFNGRFVGKTTPVHLFWHSFDLATTRFSGRPAPPMEGANHVTREAYSHEVVSFGFWAGDPNTREPAFYSYVWPEPEGLRETPLQPDGARWIEQRGGSLALYPYETLRSADDPRKALLDFLESSYIAGATLAGWDIEGLRHVEV